MNTYVWETGDNQFELGEKLVWSGHPELGIKELIAAHLVAKKRTPHYIRLVKGVIDRTAAFCAEQSPPVPPQRFGIRVAQALLKDMENRKLSDNTRRDTSVKLKTIFTWLRDEGYFPADNLARLKNPTVLHEPWPRMAILPEEIRAMREANQRLWSAEHDPKSRFKKQFVRDFHRLQFDAQFLMMIDGGLRPKETCDALLEDLDVDNCTINLHPSRTKARRARTVPLTERYVNGPLKDWLQFRMRLKELLGDRDPGTIFLTERGKPRNPTHWIRRFEHVRQASGIERKITPYTCRRHASTVHDMVDQEASKRIIGHVSDAVHSRYHVLNPKQVNQLRVIHEKANPLDGIL